MQEERTRGPGQAAQPRGTRTWSALGVLLLLAGGIHAWLIATATVTARDSIGYIRYALFLECKPWTEALPKMEQHPLYPLALLGVALPIRACLGNTPEALALSGQLANALAGVLLVIPMYFLGKELFSGRVGFWAAALFQCLPICAQVTSDALSDGLFLLLLATALLYAVRGVQQRSPLRLCLCGLASGLAYLTRPEGGLVVVTTLLVLVTCQLTAKHRWPWRRAVVGAAALGMGALMFAGPYMAVIDKLTVKPSAARMFAEADRWSPSSPLLPKPACIVGLWGIWWVDQNQVGSPPLWWAAKAVVVETVHAYHYAAWLPALIGLCWFRAHLGSLPGAWVLLLLACLFALLLGRLAWSLGYLSERHTMVIVLCGSFWTAATLVRSADLFSSWAGRCWQRSLSPQGHMLLALAWLVLWAGWCLPRTLKPLHANRTGFRMAGEWLAQQVRPGDTIIDPFCWSHFYAGGVLQEGRKRPPAPEHQPMQYVVLTHSTNAHNRFTMILEPARELARHGQLVYCWRPTPAQKRKYRAEEVQVYAVPKSIPLKLPDWNWVRQQTGQPD